MESSRTEIIVSNISIELWRSVGYCVGYRADRDKSIIIGGFIGYETDTYQKVVCRTKKGRMNRGKPLEDRTGVTCFL